MSRKKSFQNPVRRIAVAFLLVLLPILQGSTLRAQEIQLTVEGCNLCPSGLRLEFPAEYLSFSLDSALFCREERKAWRFSALREYLPVRLRCGALYRSIVLSPGTSLRIVFGGMHKGFITEQEDVLNAGLVKINAAFDSLLQNQSALIISGKGEALARTLTASLRPAVENNPFLLQHLDYTLGHFLFVTGSLSRSAVYRQFLAGKEPLWRSEAYGTLFRDFYEDLLQENLTRKKYESLGQWLKTGGSWRAVDSAVATMPFFEDSALRYPAFALGLLKISGLKEFKEAPLYRYLSNIISRPYMSPQARRFFENLHNRLRPPDPALYESLLSMKVTDTTGQSRVLSALSEGKPLLVSLCDPFSLRDLEELRLLPTLEKNFKGRLKTVALLMDGDDRILRQSHIFLGQKLSLYRPLETDKLRNIVRGRPAFVVLYDSGLRFLADDLPPLSKNAEEVIRKKLGL